jgi:hypothetical protein
LLTQGPLHALRVCKEPLLQVGGLLSAWVALKDLPASPPLPAATPHEKSARETQSTASCCSAADVFTPDAGAEEKSVPAPAIAAAVEVPKVLPVAAAVFTPAAAAQSAPLFAMVAAA